MWIHGFKAKRFANSALMGEILAIRQGLLVARQNNWSHIVLASDCKWAVDLIHSSCGMSGEYINLILECRELTKQLSEFRLLFKHRGCNKLADELLRRQGRRSTLWKISPFVTM